MAIATIVDVAERAGVGIGTVSRVINNSPQVSDGTRERVLAAIRDLDYRPSNLARGLSRGTTNTIGVVVPFFTEPSFVERLRGVTNVVNETEWDIVLYSIESKAQRDERIGSMPRPDMAAAYLLVSLPLTDDERVRFVESGAPVAHIDGWTDGIQSYYVDNELGGYLAGCHLLGLGHRRLAYVGDPDDAPFDYSPATERWAGFQRACIEHRVEPALGVVRSGREGRVDAQKITAELFDLAEPPTAIFASSDTQALGVIEAVRSRGLRVPEDCSVIGFDNIDLASYVGLTTVDQALFETGRQAATWLVEALRSDAHIERESHLLAVEVVKRVTTAPAPS